MVILLMEINNFSNLLRLIFIVKSTVVFAYIVIGDYRQWLIPLSFLFEIFFSDLGPGQRESTALRWQLLNHGLLVVGQGAVVLYT
jgi:hypothetical protein